MIFKICLKTKINRHASCACKEVVYAGFQSQGFIGHFHEAKVLTCPFTSQNPAQQWPTGSSDFIYKKRQSLSWIFYTLTSLLGVYTSCCMQANVIVTNEIHKHAHAHRARNPISCAHLRAEHWSNYAPPHINTGGKKSDLWPCNPSPCCTLSILSS